jgi:hypothetical protein
MAAMVTLLFPSMKELWQFTEEAHISSMEILSDSKTLCCECNEAFLEIALNKYGAKLLPVSEA